MADSIRLEGDRPDVCGIAGVVDPSLSTREARHLLERLVRPIRHRGPDHEGSFAADGIGLGMRRLSIIDLPGGNQPMFNEDGSLALVFNGEIYNYRELAGELSRRGHRLRTSSDTEVILHLFEDHGEKCVDHLRGMYAFALWDARKGRLFAARDRLGIKPFYYAHVGERLLFASEIKAILQDPQVEVRPDLGALSSFLSLKYVPAPQTLFAGIHSLPPGHHLTWGREGTTTERYWDLSFSVDRWATERKEVVLERFAELLRESVRLRLRSDVPFGAFLSGGLDSSTIVALMSEILEEPVKTFSVGFDSTGKSRDELPYARIAAQRFGTDHHEIRVGPQDFMALAGKVVWHLDQPIADQATIATYQVAQLAASRVKMVLTGEGGDELFAGYARYSGERLAPLFQLLPSVVRSVGGELGSRLLGSRRAKIALYALCQPDEANRLLHWFPLFNREMKEALLSPDLDLGGADPLPIIAEHLSRTDAATPLNRMLYLDTKLWLPDYLLLRGDKLTMANSLEARVPFLDHELVEFAASLPPRLKLRNLTGKYLLKRLGRDLLPEQLVDRKKQGFPIPISDWFRGEARDFLGDLLAPEAVRKRGLFQPGYVGKLFREHDTRAADHGNLLWGLAVVEIWYRTFIDARTPTPFDSRVDA